MKSIISGAVIATAIVACLSLNVQAKSISHVLSVAVSDTDKMAKDKMKMDKMDKMESKKMAKMSKGKMKKDKKMEKMSKKKMSKDTSGKM